MAKKSNTWTSAQVLCFAHTRRLFLQKLAFGTAAYGTGAFGAMVWSPGAFAEELTRTVAQTEGPFYPDRLPLDTDNDLLIVNDAITPGVGEITHLTGRILDANGNPVRNALVEIWQVDGNGAYLHSRDPNGGKRDGNFQGFGRFLTGTAGEYYFRTVKPVPYPGRTPHIHMKVKIKGQPDFTTQCYIKGHPQNDRDGIVRSIRDPLALQSVMVDFAPIKESRIGELAANFDVILGITPEA
jgi:protocatechuate 3,4-dioxygenase beta subunit